MEQLQQSSALYRRVNSLREPRRTKKFADATVPVREAVVASGKQPCVDHLGDIAIVKFFDFGDLFS